MCRFKAFMLLRFYLLKYNDTIIVQSGVFVNTKRHKKATAKGNFAAAFLVKITKFTCVKHHRSS
jgi:hypothetical protein